MKNETKHTHLDTPLIKTKSELSAHITTLSGYISAIEALEAENQRLRALCTQNGIDVSPEVCEAGCSDPVVDYDGEGSPLCQQCLDELRAESAASDRRKSIK